MLIYVVLYIFLLLISLADCIDTITKSNKLFLLFGLVFVFVLFRGLRWEVGTDWEQFYICFKNADWDNLTSYHRYGDDSEKMEVGYMFFNRLIKCVGNYTTFLLVTNLFILSTWAYLSVKLCEKRFLMTFAMIMVTNLVFPVRLQLAGGVFCWCIYYLTKKSYFKAFLFYVIACSIHKSAIVLLPFLCILNMEFKSKVLIGVVLCSSMGEALSVYLADFISIFALYVEVVFPDLATNINTYTDCEMSGASEFSLRSFVISISLCLFLLWLFFKSRVILKRRVFLKLEKKEMYFAFNIMLNCYVFFYFFLKLFSGTEMLQNFSRISNYFTIGFAFCFVNSGILLERKYGRNCVAIFFVFYYLYKLKGLLDTPYPELFYPYKSILF